MTESLAKVDVTKFFFTIVSRKSTLYKILFHDCFTSAGGEHEKSAIGISPSARMMSFCMYG